MSQLEKLRQIFSQTLAIPPPCVVDELAFNSIPEWESVAHMSLIAAMELAFDIMIDADDVVDMATFAKAQAIVAKYCGSAG